MCGLAGLVHWDKSPVTVPEISAMAHLLRHRGPDEQNSVIPCDGVGLSHTRLKVIDLSSAARQPMAGESGDVWLLFNGEIYNFRELRKELSSAGCSFRSQSDTEVVLRAYERWGSQAIRRLDGMFALAIWDGRSQELLLARDRTGKKPLYYWTDGRCTAFGSEIKALLPHGHVPVEIEEELLPYLLMFGSLPVDRTLYRGIRQVPPATLLRFSGQAREPHTELYWQLPMAQEAHRVPLEKTLGELRDLLTTAVRKRLVSDVPLGAFLSGGIDSTIVVGLMSRELGSGQLKTFSIGFEGDPRFNETAFAQVAADRFKTVHTVFTLSPQPFSLIEKLVWHHDQPFGDSSALPTYLLSQWTRSHVTVALNGDGGDELFAGYDRFRAALLVERWPHWFWKSASVLLRPASMLKGGHVRSFPHRLGRLLEAADRPLLERCLLWRSVISRPEGFLRTPSSLASALALETAQGHSSGNGAVGPLSRLLRQNFREYLPNDLHVKMDRCSMAHGLETRSPFLDTALIEWAFRLPDDLKLKGSCGKWVLRRAFDDLLPPAIRGRGKMGFGVPLGAWFRGSWREPLKDLLCSGRPRIFQYLQDQPIRQLIARHEGGAEDVGQQLWLLLTLEVWLRSLPGQRIRP